MIFLFDEIQFILSFFWNITWQYDVLPADISTSSLLYQNVDVQPDNDQLIFRKLQLQHFYHIE